MKVNTTLMLLGVCCQSLQLQGRAAAKVTK